MPDEILKSILLGVIQGITEFLPISSSGHLTLAQHFLGIYENAIQFDIVVHFATLLSVFTVMRKVLIKLFFIVLEDIKHMNFTGDGFMLLYKIIVATIPVGLVGVLLKDSIESLFHNIQVVAVAFCITGLLLLSTKFLKASTFTSSKNIESIKNISFLQSFIVGLFQMVAIIPGISRSGFSIVGGMMSRLNSVTSVYFSFIIAIPAILGATVLEAKNISSSDIDIWFLASGFLSAYISGVLGLTLVIKIAKNKKLFHFTPYLIILGLALLIW